MITGFICRICDMRLKPGEKPVKLRDADGRLWLVCPRCDVEVAELAARLREQLELRGTSHEGTGPSRAFVPRPFAIGHEGEPGPNSGRLRVLNHD